MFLTGSTFATSPFVKFKIFKIVFVQSELNIILVLWYNPVALLFQELLYDADDDTFFNFFPQTTVQLKPVFSN